MATKTTKAESIITGVVPKKEEAPVTKVSIFLPLVVDSADGPEIEQSEYVTVNGKTMKVPRGEYVDVPVAVFLQLRNRYPNL